MINHHLRKPVVATFFWAFGINFIFWFLVNVIWVELDDVNVFKRISFSYSYSQGIATGLAAPLFIGFLTAGLVYFFTRIRSRLATNDFMRRLVLGGLFVLYLPSSLLGFAGIMYVA